MFINYFDGTYKIQTSRLANAIATTLDDLLISILEQSDECLTVSVDENTLELLRDDKYLRYIGVEDQDLISGIYSELVERL